MAAVVPKIIALAFGAAALGSPDALRLLLDVAGRSPLVDIAICFFAMCMVTAYVLATVLLARFVRNPRAGAGAAAPATDLLALMTLAVSLGVAFLVFACLLVASGASDLGLVGSAWKSHVIIEVLATIGAVAVSCSSRPLLRVFHGEDNARGRFANMTQTVSLADLFPGAVGLLAVGLWAQRSPSPLVTVFVAVATVVATVLFSRFPCWARDAAGAGGDAAPTPAADAWRFGKLTQATFLAVVCFLIFILATKYAPLEREPDGAKYQWSA